MEGWNTFLETYWEVKDQRDKLAALCKDMLSQISDWLDGDSLREFYKDYYTIMNMQKELEEFEEINV